MGEGEGLACHTVGGGVGADGLGGIETDGFGDIPGEIDG